MESEQEKNLWERLTKLETDNAILRVTLVRFLKSSIALHSGGHSSMESYHDSLQELIEDIK